MLIYLTKNTREKQRRTAGLLLVTGNEEKFNVSGIDVRKANEIRIDDLWPLGRLTVYTEKAVHELGKMLDSSGGAR